MRKAVRVATAAAAMVLQAVAPALAEGEMAGEFDYYLLSLSWSANWCALEGDARGDDQCDPRHDYSFTLHGLWPQFDIGYPSWCRTSVRDPSRGETAALTDIAGSAGLVWYEWKKHGRCAGMPAAEYLDLSRKAYEAVAIPDVLAHLNRDVKLPASVVEQAFVEANPGLTPPMITITCDQGHIQEARICLTKDLAFRACGDDVARDCRMQDAVMEAVR
jgi:ribonuclease T2